MTLKWNFQRGWGFKLKNLPWEGYGYLVEQHIYSVFFVGLLWNFFDARDCIIVVDLVQNNFLSPRDQQFIVAIYVSAWTCAHCFSFSFGIYTVFALPYPLLLLIVIYQFVILLFYIFFIIINYYFPWALSSVWKVLELGWAWQGNLTAGLQVGQAFGVLLQPGFGVGSSRSQAPGHPTSMCNSGVNVYFRLLFFRGPTWKLPLGDWRPPF